MVKFQIIMSPNEITNVKQILKLGDFISGERDVSVSGKLGCLFCGNDGVGFHFKIFCSFI